MRYPHVARGARGTVCCWDCDFRTIPPWIAGMSYRVCDGCGRVLLSECIKRPLSGPTVKEHAMLESAAMWNLHLIYRLSHVSERFDDDVRGKVRALAGVTRVGARPPPDVSRFRLPMRRSWTPPARPNSAAARRATPTTPPGGGGGRQCSSWTNRPYARWRSPPWLPPRLHRLPIRCSVRA